MNKWAKKQSGFTIVELLIVVVVIAILAAITIVSYTGIRDRAQTSALQAQLDQAATQVQTAAIINGETYPATLAELGIKDGNGYTYMYSSDNTTTPKQFCVTATLNLTKSYYISSATGNTIQSGICPGQNLVMWYESDPNSSPPLVTSSNAVIDSSVKHTGVSSIRINPSTTGVAFKNSPFAVTSGQVVTVSLWVKADSTWNGTPSNSKIRFGNQSGGTLLTACGYDSATTTWTQFNCSYTVTSSVTGVAITVGNDGTTGQIWLDDISVGITGP